MTTLKSLDGVQKRPQQNRRLLRRLSKALHRKKCTIPTVDTDSDDSENEGHHRHAMRHYMFSTKRMIDQTHEGDALRHGLLPIPAHELHELQAVPPLLPPLGHEEKEPVDYYELFAGLLSRHESTSSVPCHQALPKRHSSSSSSSSSRQSIGETSCDSLNHVRPNSIAKPAKKLGKGLHVHFADDQGRDLEEVHWTVTMYSEEENDWMRAVVLLLSPKKKKYEFLHVSYNMLEKTSVSDILKQLPEIATDEALKEQQYVGLVRTNGERELINTVAIQGYFLERNEVLLAVVDGHYGKAMLRMAKPLLENKKIMKAVIRPKASKQIVVRELSQIGVSRKSTKDGDRSKVHPQDCRYSRRPHAAGEPEDVDQMPMSAPSRRKKTKIHIQKNPCRDLESSFDSIEDVPEMCFIDRKLHEDFSPNEHHNHTKMNMTRFLNAGIMTAVVFNVQRKLGRGKR